MIRSSRLLPSPIQEDIMQFYFLYSGCGANEQTEVAKASQARKPELDAKASRVGVLPSTPVVVAVEYSQAEPRWLMRASFYCERGTASAETRSNEMLDSLDNLINELSEQIDQQLERPLPAPQRRHRLSGFDSFLETFRQDDSSSHFASVLTPVLASLDRYIRRELRVRRALGELPAHQTTLQEVRDEVLARAW